MELIIIPLIAACITFFSGNKYAKLISFVGSIASLAWFSIWAFNFTDNGSFQYVFSKNWLSNNIKFTCGFDGIGFVFLLLTQVLVPLILLSTWKKDIKNAKLFYALILFMQVGLNGVFLSLDALMFYIFWEITLIPIYFIVAIWSEGNRFAISLKFFLYTFLGSLFMLASFLFLYSKAGSFAWDKLLALELDEKQSVFVGLGILLGFAVKIPLFPLHSWQPETYTAAPSAGSMLLSGIMLKMGLYGLLRWFIPIVPESLYTLTPWILAFGIIGLLYAAFIAIKQNDIKRIIAFSSMSHVALIAVGICTVSKEGIAGGILQSFMHGINVVGLFYIADIIQSRTNTRNITELGGIAKNAKWFAAAFMIITLGTTAVPFTNGFPGELLLLKATFSHHVVWGVYAGLTVILCAVYMLRMYQFSMFGNENSTTNTFSDIRNTEIVVLSLIALAVVWFGFFPQPLLDKCAPSINNLIEIVEGALGKLA